MARGALDSLQMLDEMPNGPMMQLANPPSLLLQWVKQVLELLNGPMMQLAHPPLPLQQRVLGKLPISSHLRETITWLRSS